MSLVLIDGNNWVHRYYHSKPLTVGSQQVQSVFGFIKGIRKLVEDYKGWSVVVVWDGKAQFRYDLYPEYKSSRRKDDSVEAQLKRASIKEQREVIKTLLPLMGINQLTPEHHEADDLAYALTKSAVKKGHLVSLVSSDQDWLQMLDKGVVWVDLINQKEVSFVSFEKEVGYKTPEQFLEAKILQGDSSDNIPSVSGFGAVRTKKFFDEYGSIEAFFEKHKDNAPKHKHLLNLCSESGLKSLELNRKLIDISLHPKIDTSSITRVKGELNQEELLKAFQQLCFFSIVNDFENFVKPLIKE